MEPEVHIIEKYFQEVMNCFTMTNIQLKHGHKYEIDLLAVDLFGEKYYRVESSVKTTHKLKFMATNNKKRGYSIAAMRRKFENDKVRNYVESIFNNKPYHKILVVWDKDVRELNEQCKNLGIEVRSLMGIIYQLSNHKITSGSRDDILRTMELVFLEKKWEKEVLHAKPSKNEVPPAVAIGTGLRLKRYSQNKQP